MPLPHPDQHAQEVKLKVISMRQASTMQTLKEASLSGEADVKVQLPATPSPIISYISPESDSREAKRRSISRIREDTNSCL